MRVDLRIDRKVVTSCTTSKYRLLEFEMLTRSSGEVKTVFAA